MKYYTRLVAEKASEVFIDPRDAKPCISSLCLSGSQLTAMVAADLDKRLAALCFRQEISYGGEIGLRQALARTDLLGEAAAAEVKVLERFFLLARTEPERIACGLKEVLFALNAGAVEAILLHENSKLEHPEMVEERVSLLDYFICDEESLQGAELHLIQGFDNNGNMFIKGFDGFSAILRYRFDCSSVHEFDALDDLSSEHFSDEDDSDDDSDHENDRSTTIQTSIHP